MSDYISREAALEIVKRTSGDYAAAFSEIRKLPAANMEQERDGRLVVLPCKVGDVVYGFHGEKTILPMVAKWIETNTDGWCIAAHGYNPPIRIVEEGMEVPQGTPKICPNCGKVFYDSTTKRKVYCSFDCQRTFCDRQAAQRYRDRKAAERAAVRNGG